MTNEAQGSRFVVDLGDIKLSGILERQVEAEIQAVVLRAVASLGSQLSATARSSSIWDKFPGQTLGLWPGYPERRPPGFPFGEIQPLSVRDHTIIMKAIMDHPMQVVRYLPQKYKVSPGARPSGTEVLEATLKVEQIDEYVKERIRAVLEVLPKIEDNQAALPESRGEVPCISGPGTPSQIPRRGAFRGHGNRGADPGRRSRLDLFT